MMHPLHFMALRGRNLIEIIHEPSDWSRVAEDEVCQQIFGLSESDVADLSARSITDNLTVLVANAVMETTPTALSMEEAQQVVGDAEIRVPEDLADDLITHEYLLEWMESDRKWAEETLLAAGWLWNADKRRAEWPSTGGRKRELFTSVILTLSEAWHDGGRIRAPADLVHRIRQALRWFFAPERLQMVGPTIRNHT